MKKLMHLFIVTFCLVLRSVVSSHEIWTHCTVLDNQNKYHVCWMATEDTITFKVEAKTKGYVGLGLSPHGGMAGSDIVIGWVAGGQVFLQDRHGEGNTFPPMDDSQDWELISGSENDTHTSLTIKRKLQTCDPYDMEIDVRGGLEEMVGGAYSSETEPRTFPHWLDMNLVQHLRNKAEQSLLTVYSPPANMKVYALPTARSRHFMNYMPHCMDAVIKAKGERPLTSTIRLIYSYHQDDPKSPASPSYHGRNRGARSIMLLQPKAKREENVEGMAYWDVKSPNYTITSQYSSMYWCKIHKAPELEQKHHIIKIEPLIQPNHERYVHHLVLYECVGGVPEDLETYVDHFGHECYSENMPPSMKACEGVFAAWGIGGQPMVFPDHVGLPLEEQPPKYYMLEVHYDNPSYDDNVMDESGFRIFYTSELRQYDAGTFMIGAAVTPRVFIPPLQEKFTVVGHSSYECIGAEMPDDGVKVLGVFLHAHLLGRQLRARHFRKNIELPPFADDHHYDFNYQEYHYFEENVPFLPEDQITVECVYDSSERTRVTFGGLSTKEEMCLVFVLYYPRIERFGCLSVSPLPLVAGLVGAVEPTYEDPNIPSAVPTLAGLIGHVHNNMDWDSVNVSVMENALRYSPHQTYCYIGTGSKGKMKDLVTYPKNLVPYEKPSKCPSKVSKHTENVENIPGKDSGHRVECTVFIMVFSVAFASGF